MSEYEKLVANRDSWKSLYVDYRSLNVYQFLDDCYTGKGGFEGRVVTDYKGFAPRSYIHPNLTENFYVTRVQNACYVNYFKKYVNAKFRPVFASGNNKTFVETSTGIVIDNHPYLGFVDNITGNGNDKDKFLQNILKSCYTYDVVFVAMDKMGDGLNPYCYVIRPETVIDYNTDSYGQLTGIKFLVEYNADDKAYYRRNWNLEEFSYEVSLDDMKTWKIVDIPIKNTLGALPVKALFATEQDDAFDYKPFPSLYDLGALMVWLYNKGANLDYLIEKQVHSLLVLNGTPAPISDAFSNALVIPMDIGGGTPFEPKYLSPDSSLSTKHSERIDQVITSMFDLMSDTGVTASQSQVKTESGVAKSYTFNATNTQLKGTIQLCEELDSWLLDTYKLYQLEPNADYNAYTEYPSDFTPKTSLTPDELIRVAEFMKTENLQENYKDVIGKVVQLLNPNMSKETMEPLQSEIEGLISGNE